MTERNLSIIRNKELIECQGFWRSEESTGSYVRDTKSYTKRCQKLPIQNHEIIMLVLVFVVLCEYIQQKISGNFSTKKCAKKVQK